MKNMAFLPYILRLLGGMDWPKIASGGPQLAHNPGDVFTGRSKTFKRNLRAVQKRQRRRAFYRSLRR